MRKLLFLITLVLAACSGNGDGTKPATEPVQHFPEILELTLSPETAAYMEGDGNVVVTAEITFSDSGEDIKTLWVRTPDGTTSQFDERIFVETGTLTEDFTVPTNRIGAFHIEIWLEDRAGDSSAHRVAEFTVIDDGQHDIWTSRLSGLPHPLFDVVWNGSVFIAVGGRGAIFTSADGIEWVAIKIDTDANLYAVATDGPYVIAVGFELEGGPGIILQSTDHGASWTVKARPAGVVLEAVAINASTVVVGGNRWGWGTGIALISEDRGETWRAVDSWPDEELPITDLVYGDGMFVAATNGLNRSGEAWVTVSADGNLWTEIAVNDEPNYLPAIFHGDGQFFLAGGSWSEPFAEYLGTVYTSMDGFNWTQLQTPVEDVFYRDVASDGTKLMVAGSATCGYLGGKCFEQFDVPVGLASTDGGVTWDIFNIDGDYESFGLAWGNGRFVSVGQSEPWPGEGAIYTTD
jgi:hypothetical protein